MKHQPKKPEISAEADITPEDEAFFQDYLKKNSRLSRQFQKIPTPEPSSELDQLILEAAQKQTRRPSWWYHPGSWAATLAIVSLAGLLSHNIWQSDQQQIKQKHEQSVFPASTLSAPDEKTSQAPTTEADTINAPTISRPQTKAEPAGLQPAKQAFTDASIDTRQLRFKSVPAPVKPAPQVIQSVTTEAHLSEEELEAMTLKRPDIATGSVKKQMPATSEIQQLLDNIRQLIERGQKDEARAMLAEFKKRFPEHTVDPVILQQLSPY